MRKSRLVTLAVSLAATTIAALTLANPAGAASSDHYVALGDSYSSGVGAGDYTSESGSCDRSPHAYSALWAAAHSPAAYVSVACAGATTTSVISSQLSALSASTTLVTITAGGNDAGFANIMETCALEGTSDCVAAVQAGENFSTSTLPGLLNTLYNGIRSHAPHAHVIVLDYPAFYQLNTFCVGLSATSHAKINEGANVIDGVMQTAAAQHGFTFGDVRGGFVGHQLCSGGTKWLHALNFLDITESYHPTAAGHSGGYYPVLNALAP